ncbi:MAG TPA: FxsA family protein [Longimicrobiales bacterium]|nr:FxsA family protein [Longimicrobiales bacterium]
MLGFLILLFIALPVLELVLLLRIGSWIGALPTILLVIATGIVGASLARTQGVAVLARIQRELAQGRPPVASMVDGFLIFAAGVLLLTPGVITDVFGVAFLLPPVRALVRRGLAGRLQRMAEAGTARFTVLRNVPHWPQQETREPAERPQGRDVSNL